MTYAELRDAVETVLGEVAFNPPVSVEYCSSVRDALRTGYLAKLQNEVYSMEVYFRGNELHVNVWLAPIDRDKRIKGSWVTHRLTYPLD